MIFKDKEVMEKLDQLEEMIKDLKSQIADITFCIDKIMIEFDVEPVEHAAMDRNEEIWLTYYHGAIPTSVEVSNYGNVRNVKTKKIAKLSRNANGLPRAWFIYEKAGSEKSSSATIANMVATMFIDRSLPVGYRGIVHIDGNEENNNVDNLMVRKN